MKNLRDTRKAKGINQHGLSMLTNLNVATINHLENGKTITRADTQQKIEKALGQRIDWLTTAGFDSVAYGEIEVWTHAEQNLRKAMKDIKTLQNKPERAKYIQMVRHYANVLEREFINAKTMKL
jgi:transcriptional regulator with XRE-family HTH domain